MDKQCRFLSTHLLQVEQEDGHGLVDQRDHLGVRRPDRCVNVVRACFPPTHHASTCEPSDPTRQFGNWHSQPGALIADSQHTNRTAAAA